MNHDAIEGMAAEIGAQKLYAFGSDEGNGARCILRTQWGSFIGTTGEDKMLAYLYGLAKSVDRLHRLSAASARALGEAHARLTSEEFDEVEQMGVKDGNSATSREYLEP